MSGESSVSSNNINENYPIPGQNNSSQGLRDNFAAVKLALNRASIELTQIRQNGVFRAPITGVPYSNNLQFNPIFNAQLTSYSETVFEMGLVSESATIDFSQGNFQRMTMVGETSLVFKKFPTGSQSGTVKLWVTTQLPSLKLYLPNSVNAGNRSSFITNNTILLPSRGDYVFTLSSYENGTRFLFNTLHGLTDYRLLPATGGASSVLSGIINADYLPVANVDSLGAVKVDGTTIGIYNGTISVIGGLSETANSSITKTGTVYSYMYEGVKATDNQFPFHMLTLSGMGANGTISLTLAHHHSGGGQHGAYTRRSYAVNAYTQILEMERYDRSFDPTPTGNIGFDITRPNTSNIEIRWMGNVSFGQAFGFFMTIDCNQPVTIHRIGLD